MAPPAGGGRGKGPKGTHEAALAASNASVIAEKVRKGTEGGRGGRGDGRGLWVRRRRRRRVGLLARAGMVELGLRRGLGLELVVERGGGAVSVVSASLRWRGGAGREGAGRGGSCPDRGATGG